MPMARDNAEDGGDFIFGKNEQQQQSTYMKRGKVVVFCNVLPGSGWVSSILIIKDQLYINYN